MARSIKIIIKTDRVPKFCQEMIDRKNAIKAFHRGELTYEQLNEKGIKFATPI